MLTVDEGAGTATVSVMVDDAVMSGFSVDAMTDDGTATAPGDYTAVSGQTLSFAGTFVGETQTFTVSIIDDALYEGGALGIAETVAVSLVNPENATNVDSSNTATISITDNEYQVALTMEDVSVSEGAGMATVSVSLDTAVTYAFSVVASIADGTAIAGEDYTAVPSQTLSFTGAPAGETQTFSVTHHRRRHAGIAGNPDGVVEQPGRPHGHRHHGGHTATRQRDHHHHG